MVVRRKKAADKITAEKTKTEAPAVAELTVEATPAPPVKMRAKTYVVREGLALTTLAGVISGGAVVKQELFSGGQEVFEQLIASGAIVERAE